MRILAQVQFLCSMFPKSTHETFAQKMYQTYKGNKRFSKPKLARTDFIINHYAGDVRKQTTKSTWASKGLTFMAYKCKYFFLQVVYQADQFLDKNKDYVVAEHQALLYASSCSFVANLFPPLPEETSKQSKFSSIGTRFKVKSILLKCCISCWILTEWWFVKLNSTSATTTSFDGNTEHNRTTLHPMCKTKYSFEAWNFWELQCLKPVEVWGKWDSSFNKKGQTNNIVTSISNFGQWQGVLEAIRISCAGYPTKRSFDEFLDRFGVLAPEALDGYGYQKTNIYLL